MVPLFNLSPVAFALLQRAARLIPGLRLPSAKVARWEIPAVHAVRRGRIVATFMGA